MVTTKYFIIKWQISCTFRMSNARNKFHFFFLTLKMYCTSKNRFQENMFSKQYIKVITVIETNRKTNEMINYGKDLLELKIAFLIQNDGLFSFLFNFNIVKI